MIRWMEGNGMGIGNETTEGDEEGESTHTGSRDCTTIDYVVRNEAAKERVKMVVGDKIKSYHLPIEVRLEGGKTGMEVKRGINKREVIRWDEEGEWKEETGKIHGKT